MLSDVLGLDIGGANLKMAHSAGLAVQRAFALWKQPHRLAAALHDLLAEAPVCARLAVTMTGELCDCYATKREGVNAILDSVEEAARAKRMLVWTNDGAFVAPEVARQEWHKVASANWLATAAWAGRFAPRDAALLIDIGSTTTDIVPLWHGRPMPLGHTDSERLASGELVYTGARRTPVCALLDGEGMAEFFATTLDVYLCSGRRPEAADDCDTADGRPATRAGAHARLARMYGGDAETTSEAETRRLAERIAVRQADLIRKAAARVAARLPAPPAVVLTAGSGAFLADAVSEPLQRVSLAEVLGPTISQAAAAWAVATLASESR